MNKENASKLWKIIQEAGDYLGCQWDNLLHTTSHYFALVMWTIEFSPEINCLKTHQFKQKTMPQTRPDLDKSNNYFSSKQTHGSGFVNLET